MKVKLMVVLVWLTLLVTACNSAATPQNASENPEPVTLSVMTHDSFSVSESVLADFEKTNNVKVVFVQSGDTGQLLNRAILSKDSPMADVIFGVDNTFLSRALTEDIFEPYNSKLLAEIPAEFQLDKENRALPVDYGDVCINYDKAYFEENKLALPASLEELTKPGYAGLLVVENPSISSPGMGFLLATIAEFGEDGYLEYWKQLRENGVVVVNDWETAYYTNFSASSGRGAQPLVVSYGSSPPAEVIFASEPLQDAPTASLVGKNMCFRQIEFVGIVKGTPNRFMAERFVDFLLGKTFQDDVVLQMFVYPVNKYAEIPEEFVKFAQQPQNPAILDMDLVAEKRDSWVLAWDEVVLR